jgi:hypothetical protein
MGAMAAPGIIARTGWVCIWGFFHLVLLEPMQPDATYCSRYSALLDLRMHHLVSSVKGLSQK